MSVRGWFWNDASRWCCADGSLEQNRNATTPLSNFKNSSTCHANGEVVSELLINSVSLVRLSVEKRANMENNVLCCHRNVSRKREVRNKKWWWKEC